MSDNENNSGVNDETNGLKNAEKPLIGCDNIDIKVELENLVKLLDGKINEEEEIVVEEMHQYFIEGDCWALSDNFLLVVGRILSEPSFSSSARICLLRILAYSALKEDFIILLHQDRRDHTLMNFANDIDKHNSDEQLALGNFMCNLFANPSASEWLLYISEWQKNNISLSNIRVTTKVTVHCVLSNCPILKNIGTSILFNLAIKEVKTLVFDELAVELAMAILQFFTSNPNEEEVYRSLRALVRFMEVSNDVPSFIQMIGPHPKMFAGMSERVDELLRTVSRKVPC